MWADEAPQDQLHTGYDPAQVREDFQRIMRARTVTLREGLHEQLNAYQHGEPTDERLLWHALPYLIHLVDVAREVARERDDEAHGRLDDAVHAFGQPAEVFK